MKTAENVFNAYLYCHVEYQLEMCFYKHNSNNKFEIKSDLSDFFCLGAKLTR